MDQASEWYKVVNVEDIDSPALLVYKDRVKANIEACLKTIDDPNRLRPHIKTCKSAEVAQMMMRAGIMKFKCATIAEAEMLADASAPDILLAYQPLGPKAERLAQLIKKFQNTRFSCLIDNGAVADHLDRVMQNNNASIDVFIDLNVGMNRTGIRPDHAFALFSHCQKLNNIRIVGLHAYDGHLRDQDFDVRKAKCDEAFSAVTTLKKDLEEKFKTTLRIVAGGTPTYSIHCKRKDIECSPGTFVYWDKGYEQTLHEQHYNFAALVITRVVSKPSENIICVDLGHKAIASENPLANRVYFLNAPDVQPIGHSEEHLVLQCTGKSYEVGDIFYGVPHHVCPTVALHDEANVVEGNMVNQRWRNVSRGRKIKI